MRDTVLIGNVTREPEGRFTPTGKFVCNFGLAVNEKWGAPGQEQEKVHFFDISAWDTLGENIADTVTKGMRVIVSGRLDYNSWEDDAGNKRNTVKIVASGVGPELRWASATVTKNERTGGAPPAGAHRHEAAPAAPGPAPGPGPESAPEGYYDDEPFWEDAGVWLPGAWGRYPDRKL